jgi:hypothetical protein
MVMTPASPADLSGTRHVARRLPWLVMAAWLIIGCEQPPPPPVAQTAPVQPPPPVQADPQLVARNLGPFYFVLFNRGFSADVVETPSRWRMVWPMSEIDFKAKVDFFQGQQPPNPEMARRLQDAWKATPPLAAIAAAYGIVDPGWATAVAEWAKLVAPPPYTGGRAVMPPGLARDTVLAITLRQAIQDADRKNYHRAHVLLTDVSHVMGEESPLRSRDSRDVFIRFFREVPDTARFEDFAGRLTAYSEAREKEVLLAGEHAAVLHAAGLTAAADFMREQLLAQFDVITLPMIDEAIRRGVSFGFQAPERVMRLRSRLEAHAAVLREGAARSAEPYRREAVAQEADPTYRQQLADFEKLFDADGGGAEEGRGAEKLLEQLEKARRPVSDWLREKAIVTRHAPLLTLRQPMTYRFLSMISPLGYDTAAKQLVRKATASLPADADRLGDTLAAWCRGESLPDTSSDGSAHALLAWYWLECGRPELARAALIGGGRELLQKAKRIPREEVVKLQDGAAGVLLDELNGYRFLIAAAEIEAAPAGAVRGAGARYLPELAVLLANWQRMWEDCALPPLAAELAVVDLEDQVAEREAAGSRLTESRERYSFRDWSFTHGAVPDVLIERAMEKNLFGPGGDAAPPAAGFQEFLLDFKWPSEFSPGSRERWKAPARKS